MPMPYSNTNPNPCSPQQACCNNECGYKSRGGLCRSAMHSCDHPEYCSGENAECGDDLIKASGESCPEGTDGTCNLGVCRSYDGQCKNILGTSYYHGLCRRKQESGRVCGELLCQRRGSRDDTSCVTAASLLVAPVGGGDAKDDLTSQVADGTECRR